MFGVECLVFGAGCLVLCVWRWVIFSNFLSDWVFGVVLGVECWLIFSNFLKGWVFGLRYCVLVGVFGVW